MTIAQTDAENKTVILVSVIARKKVLFIIPYPLREAPSQRFRFEQYFEALSASLIEYETQSFLTAENWRLFYGPGKITQKAIALTMGFWRRTVGLFGAWQADFVFIHREASPLGPPIFEWIIAKVLRKRIIYDFDDAIWLTDKRREPALTRLLKHRGKVSAICRWSYRVSCGNAFLAEYARRFCNNVTINPTTIDTGLVHNPDASTTRQPSGDAIVIGWTGSHSTLKFLELLDPVLKRLEQEHPEVRFLVIADKPPKLTLNRLTFSSWNADSEIADLMKLDIGLMPLPNDEWSKGKCGFKILQYMSLRIPSVSAAVGVNTDIVNHGENGFLCSTDEEWIICLRRLVEDASLRHRLGEAGRSTVINRYSVSSNTPTFLSLFE